MNKHQYHVCDEKTGLVVTIPVEEVEYTKNSVFRETVDFYGYAPEQVEIELKGE